MPITLPLLAPSSATPNERDIKKAVTYIRNHWEVMEHLSPKDDGTLIGLPNRYIVPASPSENFTFTEQYYWDSYFTSLGYNGEHGPDMIEGMLENLIHLYKRFSMIPTANRMYFTSRSQPPLLSSYIFHVYQTLDKSKEWLKHHIDIAIEEYNNVWMSTAHPHWHNINGLNRYYDINALHDLAEAESGWDMTTRFERKCLDFLPIDLNALLFKYETDFAHAAEVLGDEDAHIDWLEKAAIRHAKVDTLMWNESKNSYFDYNYVKQAQSGVWSLAAYYPLWAGMASDEQAASMAKHLSKFMKKGGLSSTTRPLVDMSIFGSIKTQWAYPNGWAPLHYIATEGLERYGYHDQAKQVASAWISTNLTWFKQHGEFIEKYNVVSPTSPPKDGVYPSQSGFGWTNAIFVYYANKYFGIS